MPNVARFSTKCNCRGGQELPDICATNNNRRAWDVAQALAHQRRRHTGTQLPACHTVRAGAAHLPSGPPRTGASPAESSLLFEGTGAADAHAPSTAAPLDTGRSLPLSGAGCVACVAPTSGGLAAAPLCSMPGRAPSASTPGAAGAIWPEALQPQATRRLRSCMRAGSSPSGSSLRARLQQRPCRSAAVSLSAVASYTSGGHGYCGCPRSSKLLPGSHQCFSSLSCLSTNAALQDDQIRALLADDCLAAPALEACKVAVAVL